MLLPILFSTVIALPAPAPPAQWRETPAVSEMAAAYPAGARARSMVGRAKIRCTVLASGRMADCVVVSETPAGQGFGAAALSLAPRFQVALATGAGGGPAVGSRLVIPMSFTPPAGAARVDLQESIECYATFINYLRAAPNDFAVTRAAETAKARADLLAANRGWTTQNLEVQLTRAVRRDMVRGDTPERDRKCFAVFVR